MTLAQQFAKTQTAVWTPERAEAYLDESNLIRRRAAASTFLWHQWQETRKIGKEMSLHLLKLWRQMEVRQETLTPPAWFIASLHIDGKTDAQRKQIAEQKWQQQLGDGMVATLRGEMRELVQQIRGELEG